MHKGLTYLSREEIFEAYLGTENEYLEPFVFYRKIRLKKVYTLDTLNNSRSVTEAPSKTRHFPYIEAWEKRHKRYVYSKDLFSLL